MTESKPLDLISRNMKPEIIRTKQLALTRVMSITSGKGGVGKTHCSINLAIALARLGKNVLVLDADLGLANVDVMLGLKPQGTLHDVILGSKTLSEIILDGPEGIAVIPSSSGIQSLCTLSAAERVFLLQEIERVAADFDYLLIDTSAGISTEVMYFNSASAEVVCVITGEPTSLTDAYATIKVLGQQYGEKNIAIIANNVPNAEEGLKSFNRLARSVQRFLQVELSYLGAIPTDASVGHAVQEQRAVIDMFPSSRAAVAVAGIARRIDAEFHDLRVKGGMQFFFRQLMELSTSGSYDQQ